MEIDLARLRLLGDLQTPAGRAAVETLLRAYLHDTRTRLDLLRESARAGDRAAMRRLAHQMKGSSAMIGASHLADLFAGLEAAATAEARDVGEPLASAERGLASVVLEVESWFGEQV